MFQLVFILTLIVLHQYLNYLLLWVLLNYLKKRLHLNKFCCLHINGYKSSGFRAGSTFVQRYVRFLADEFFICISDASEDSKTFQNDLDKGFKWSMDSNLFFLA